jgi:predicted nucleic acid-binding protein
MAVKVIDASALAAILFAEPEGGNIIQEIGEDELVGPAVLLPLELANVCLTKIRRHPAQRELLLSNYLMVERMEIRYMDLNVASVLLLAEHRALTTYDAAYLFLSIQLGAALITLDKLLANAAGKSV